VVARLDLLTLYFLAIGTLLLSAGMTLWEWQARPERSKELRVLAAGYATLAVGCALATFRSHLTGFGPGLSNISMVAGYLLILHGVASLSERNYRLESACMLVALSLTWVIGGDRWKDGLWSYVSAFPIAVASGLTAWEMLRSDQLRSIRSRRVVAAITAGHALFYAGRTFALPWLTAFFGPAVLSVAGKVTMYEGVLYSVGLPMALLALIREEAHDQLLEASRTDYLTGLGNRRWFFEEGERLLRARNPGQPISLLAFDLDHFKSINDRYGHAKGDDVLRLFADIAQSMTGPGTILARVGGEEFVALLPGHSRLPAREVGQAVGRHFAQTVAHNSKGIGVEATVSIGLAEFGSHGTDLADLLSAADRALYVAKSRGRNRIEVAPAGDLALAC
jgi:diguanylate cyclase (GGDEF)-like protein